VLKASNTAVSSAEIVSKSGASVFLVVVSVAADAPVAMTAHKVAISGISFFMWALEWSQHGFN
jgi:hypothetical protein